MTGWPWKAEKAEAVVAWREMGGTPGLLLGCGQESGLPHLLFVTPDAVHAQAAPAAAKAKPLEFLALDDGPDPAALALLLLAEDGELELFRESR